MNHNSLSTRHKRKRESDIKKLKLLSSGVGYTRKKPDVRHPCYLSAGSYSDTLHEYTGCKIRMEILVYKQIPWPQTWWWRAMETLSSLLSADSRFAPSQWETALLCNDVSRWLGASLESTMLTGPLWGESTDYRPIMYSFEVCFVGSQNKLLNQQSSVGGWGRSCDVTVMKVNDRICHWYGSTWIPIWIGNYIRCKVWVEINHFQTSTVEPPKFWNG